jgi:hypothetical protein
MPFGRKNARATFQRTMTYIFHDLAQIILAYLDDLTARSKRCTRHLNDLRIIFQQCLQYSIRLNPLKCLNPHMLPKHLRLSAPHPSLPPLGMTSPSLSSEPTSSK